MSKGKDESMMLTATCSDTEIVIHADKEIYNVWRRFPGAKDWGEPIVQRKIGHEFVDRPVAGLSIEGRAFEYKIRDFNGASGYILAGSKIPLVDNRGKLVLVIEATTAGVLRNEWSQFVRDLVGEGYEVIVKFCLLDDSPEHVKSLIKAEYDADPANVKAAILLGAVPVKMSGPVDYDGHGPVVVAADGFYGDMTGDWTNSPSIFPAHLNLVVSRIDFSDLTCFSNKPNNPRSELDLLRQYLNRNHAWRTGQWTVTPRGAIRDGFTTEDSSRDFARNGWGNMSQLCRDGIEEIQDGQFFFTVTINDYLITFAAGGGQITSMAGTGGSDDFATNNIRTPFVMLLGSAMLGRWHEESSFPRSALACGNHYEGCLVAFGAGAPHMFLHYAGLGEPIGGSWLRSVNNYVVYPPTGNVEAPPGGYVPMQSTGIPPCGGRVHSSFHGDPTLVLDPVKPVTNLIGTNGPPLTLSWDALGFPGAADAEYGWRVYRSANPHGPFELIMETLHPFVTIDDHFPGLFYMVRAVKLVETPSGSFFAASCGVFWSDSQTPPMPPTPGQIMSKATFIESDPETGGEWADKYGDDGHLIVAGENTPPRYATIIPGPHEQYEWANPLNDKRALFANAIGSTRVAAVWYSGSAPGFTVEIKSDAAAHLLALYFLDWDVVHGRHQRVDILDGATDVVLDSREVSNFEGGKYLVYEFQGSIKIRLTKLAGPNAVLSGIFFSPVETPDPTLPPAIELIELDVLASTDGGTIWKIVKTIEIDAAGVESAIFKLAIR